MSITSNIKQLRDDIAATALRRSRNPDEIKLVAVTKYSEPAQIMEAYDAGLRDFGENKIQSALAKMPALPDDIRWHMIGHLQRNKVKYALGRFAMVHSVDSVRILETLSRRAETGGAVQSILIEINLSREESKSGADPEDAEMLVRTALSLPGVALKGFMTMAPLTDDKDVIRDVFAGLRGLRDRMEDTFGVSLQELSMGMTNDYRIAIEEGATILRIGSGIFLK